jgi:transketolase
LHHLKRFRENNMAQTRESGSAHLEDLAVDTIRVLSMEAVERANSGHPGLPMGCADFAYVLFTKFLKFNPRNTAWPDRDRFILSAGHGSMLLYSLLHLTGYDLPLEELKSFRQWGSRTPGHPEYGHTAGVETTTGPLGQGLGNAVGMALAERLLAARFNLPGFSIVDHHTYALVSDGDLMEGISHEAASLAGHLRLGKLTCFYDQNHVTIEGDTDLAFTEDVGRRFEAYGWHVQRTDGHDRRALGEALQNAREETARPSIIIGRTTIARGSPHKAGSHEAHGAPLGKEEVAATRKNLGWDYPEFTVPEEVRPLFSAPGEAGREKNRAWDELLGAYREAHPGRFSLWDRAQKRELPAELEKKLPSFKPEDKPIATRAASGKVLNALKDVLPELIGGSADLAPSNNTMISGEGDVGPEKFAGRNLHFGVREHAMGAILNGMCLHGGLRPYGGTFLIFSDYMRPAVRLAALMGQPTIFVYTHDSVFLGEDGPTHQPIEHLASLRAIPNLQLLRPADANETTAAWALALRRTSGPSALVLTRQNLPIYADTGLGKGSERGGYVLEWEGDPRGRPDVIILATGSEVQLAREAAKLLRGRGVRPRVVNLFCWDLFDSQPPEYREEVLPPSAGLRISVEAASPLGWERYTGQRGRVFGLNRFGASAPQKVIAEKLGFTGENVARVAMEMLSQ